VQDGGGEGVRASDRDIPGDGSERGAGAGGVVGGVRRNTEGPSHGSFLMFCGAVTVGREKEGRGEGQREERGRRRESAPEGERAGGGSGGAVGGVARVKGHTHNLR